MIVYRKQEQTVLSSYYLAFLRSLPGGLRRHEQAVELLIEYGAFESGVTDALCTDVDSDSWLVRELRSTGALVGRLFFLTWEGRTAGLEEAAGNVLKAFDGLAAFNLPEKLCVRIPEGYAHYSLYPETYLEAAKAFFREVRPSRVVCIGARSIGTSLSAVVSAALEALGTRIVSYTFRPRGHPFDRKVSLSPGLERNLRSLKSSYFAVVDEGPGLSGTSLCSIAEKLSQLGIADNRIVLFPSWSPDGDKFVSADARSRWRRHRKYTANFEDAWIETGRLGRRFPAGDLSDISAGGWRPIFYRNGKASPAVHPYHERRKYLFTPSSRDRESTPFFVKFSGLGRYGRSKLERAERLASAGYSPPVVGLRDGFLITQFIRGRPLSRKDVKGDLIGTLAGYLDFLRNAFPVAGDMRFEEVAAMIRRNVFLGLGDEWVDRLSFLDAFRSAVSHGKMAAIDGRMMPHEWFSTGNGYLKMDGIDHHADQFFPCCRDIAWDIAGTLVEFALAREEQDYFIRRYLALSGDRDIRRRLPFYLIAYPAYRMGYTTFAANELEPSSDGKKFRALADRYAALLKKKISGFAVQ